MKTKKFWVLAILLLAVLGSVLTVCTTYEQDRLLPAISAVDVQENLPNATPGYEDLCDHKARVVFMSEEGLNQPHLILKDEGVLLHIVSIKSDFELEEGQFVYAGFEKVYPPMGENMTGIPVNVLCIRLRNPDPDELPPDPCAVKGKIVALDHIPGVPSDPELPKTLYIKLKSGDLLYPKEMKTEFRMEDGQYVLLGFEFGNWTLDNKVPETRVMSVIVTCMRLRSPDPDEDLGVLDDKIN